MLTLRVLSDEDVQRLHSASLDVLSNVGIRICHDETLRGLEKAGAYVDYGKQLVKMPRRLVEESLKKAPKSYVLAGRSPEMDLIIEPGKTYTRCASGSLYIIDQKTRQCRAATGEDVKNFTKLQDALENISLCGGSPYPSDVPPVLQDICQIKIMLENTRKHIRFQPLSDGSMEYIVKLAGAASGGEGELKRRPMLSCITAPTSPLVYSKEQTQIIVQCGKYGLPVMMASTPIVGATGPVTLEGSLLLQNIEILGGITMAQVMTPGAPVSYGPGAPTMDMRTGLSSWGAVEGGLASAAGAQMGQFYGIETDLSGAVTDSKVSDEQAAAEKVYNTMLPALAGANILNGAGILESVLSVSMEQLVIDNEIFGMMFRVLKGIEVNEETMAENVIRHVGPGGHFLGQEHTLRHYGSEHFIPEIFDRENRDAWEKAGSRDVIIKAKERSKKLMIEHDFAPLDKNKFEQLEEIFSEAKRDLA
jgi:trimethylamine--corrinoid protein Co-methyltransferase